MKRIKLELVFALGLLAIFGIIRYCTDPIPPKEMTCLFVFVAVFVNHALSKNYIGYIELISVNLILVRTLWALEKILMLRREDSLQVIYENIENLHKDKANETVHRLAFDAQAKKRTGSGVSLTPNPFYQLYRSGSKFRECC